MGSGVRWRVGGGGGVRLDLKRSVPKIVLPVILFMQHSIT